jgi:hypothetical protein
MYIHNQEEIGVAIGVAGSVRSSLSTLASTIYVAILNNRLAITIPAAVTPAVMRAGFDKSLVSELLSALAIGTPEALNAVKDITPNIINVATVAYKDGSTSAYRTVFLASLAFTGTGIVLSLFAPSIDNRMTNKVAVKLHKRREEKELEQGKQAVFNHDEA